MVRTPNPEGGPQPSMTPPSIPMGDSRGRAQDPRRCMCTHTCVNKCAHTHTHFRHRDACGLEGTDYKQEFWKLNPNFPATYSIDFYLCCLHLFFFSLTCDRF